MGSTRRSFTEEYKAKAVNFVIAGRVFVFSWSGWPSWPLTTR